MLGRNIGIFYCWFFGKIEDAKIFFWYFLTFKENEAIVEDELNEDKIKLLGKVDREKDFDEQEFEDLWASEVLGMTGAKKAFNKMKVKDFEKLETQTNVKQKESSKNVRYSNNTKQEDF